MKLKGTLILLAFTIFFMEGMCAQERISVFPLHFRMGSAAIDSAYRDNGEQLKKVVEFVEKATNDSNISVQKITYCGSASPEGNYRQNRRLAKARIDALKDVVNGVTQFPDSIITIVDNYIEWDSLKCMVAGSNLRNKQEVLDIIAQDEKLVPYGADELIDERVVMLQRLDGGKVWSKLRVDFFAQMRNAYAIFVTYNTVAEVKPEQTVVAEKKAEIIDSIFAPAAEPSLSDSEDATAAAEDAWVRHFYLKTNSVEWALAISNIAAEIDLSSRFSVALPISYSGWNYGSSKVKFRKFSLYPELRYWLSGSGKGVFAGAHMGIAWYNFAINGKYRYQDKDGSTPALGGGVSVGYRMPVNIGKSGRWNVEFACGLGVYRLHHDKFINESNGVRHTTERKTYVGPEQVSVSLTYTFDLH